jgi:hypothetical protein
MQMYLERIAAYDKKGPAINAIISLNPTALEEADRLDTTFRRTGFIGPLHSIPVIMKDQADIKGMPTTLGSALFKDYIPERDCFVVSKLKKAGVIFLGKATLGELGGGDTHGSLFGSTRNVYDQFLCRRGRAGGLCVDPSPRDLERRRRHAPNHGAGEPRRRLWRLADHQRLARADGANGHRPRQAPRCAVADILGMALALRPEPRARLLLSL